MTVLSLISSATPTTSGFIRDLALIMCVAAGITLLFQRLRQPVVLGYLLAGVILGPHLFLDLIEERGTLEILSQLGVVLLLYSLGLEFRLRKLRDLGPSAAFVTVLEVGVMLWLGFSAARLLGWSAREALFTGGILAISSTTLIRKVFSEQSVERKTQELVTGVLVFEDLMAILMLATLTALATGEELELRVVAGAAGRLALFVGLVVAGGLVIVPRLVRGTVALGRRETLLVAALGVCFAFALLAARAGYSMALGAFLAGSLVAESGHGERIEKLIQPVRDMFGALFFVSVGMLIDPDPIVAHWRAALVLTGLAIGGKLLGVSAGAFLSGKDTQSSIRAGLCMAQIGEFSFVIAALGVASGATREFFYPLAVAVSSATAFVSPILIAHADRIARLVERSLPARFATFARLYSGWLDALRERSSRDTRWGFVRHAALVVLVDALVLAALVITGTQLHERLAGLLKDKVELAPILAQSIVILVVALLCVLPLLGMVRGARRLGAALAELSLPATRAGRPDASATARRALTAGLQVAVLLAVALPSLLLTEPFLPGFTALGLLMLLLVLSLSMIWRSTAELGGHVRSGAGVIVEALGHSSRTAPPPVDEVAALLPERAARLELRVPPHSRSVGATLASLGLCGAAGIHVVLIQRGAQQLVLPGGNEVVHAGDVLTLSGSEAGLAQLFARLDLVALAPPSAVGGE